MNRVFNFNLLPPNGSFLRLFLFFCVFSCLTTSQTAAQISGRVFLDYNQDATQQIGNSPSETGIEAVNVKAYNAANALVGTAATDVNGDYLITPLTGAVRLEFIYPPQYFPTTGSATNNTVRIVSGGATGVNLGLHDPSKQCGTAPDILVNCYVFGDQINGAYKDMSVLLTFPYSAGANASVNTAVADYALPSTHAYTVAAKDIGPTWGIAYRKTTKEIFTGATMKRHMGFGPGGSGMIYKLDYTNLGATPTLFASLPTGTDPHNSTDWLKDYKTVTGEPYANTHDAVGKIGIGGVEIIEDANNPNNDKVFAINLYNRNLYTLNANTGATISWTNSFLTLAGAAQSCPIADVRPFGLGKKDGKLYIGLVCTGESSNTWPGANNGVWDVGEPFRDNGNGGGIADNNICDGGEFYKDIGIANRSMLRAYVYQYNPATSSLANSPALEWDLNFKRGCVGNGNIGELWDDPLQDGKDVCDSDGYRNARWNPWTPDFKTLGLNSPENRFVFPQPAVSDIEFDENGVMLISMWDRGGFQGGNQTQSHPDIANTTLFQGQTAGDIHCASPSVTPNKWTLETNGSCHGATTAGLNDDLGPGGGQFYAQDAFPLWQGTTPPFTNFSPAPNAQHQQIVIGGLMTVPGSNEVMAAVFDPIPVSGNFEDQGIHVYNNNTGALTRAYQLVDGSPVGGNNPGPAAKDAGLGDLEAACASQPIEIGNLVWFDTDKDGVQDPGEAPIPNLPINLYNYLGIKVGSTTTDNDGFYKFDNANVDTTGNNGSGGFTGLHFGKTYTIVVGESQFASNTLTVSGQKYVLTAANATAGNGNDENDSDGLSLAAGQLGSLAALAGFPSTSIIAGGSGGNKQLFDFGFKPALPDLTLTKTVNNATPSQGANVVFTIKVKNEGLNNATGVTVHDTLPVGMTFVSTIPSGVYNASTKLWTIGNLNAGDSATLAMTVHIDSVGVGYNSAEIHSMNETDTDSSPNNNTTTEDDIARVCISVPIPLCTSQNQTLTLTIPTGYTNIKWFKDNVEISGQTTNTLVVNQLGNYTFTANEAICPAQGCCPVQVVGGNCPLVCKPIICLGIAVMRQ